MSSTELHCQSVLHRGPSLPVQRTFEKDGRKGSCRFSEYMTSLEAVYEDLSFGFLSATGLMVTLCPVFERFFSFAFSLKKSVLMLILYTLMVFSLEQFL